MAWNPASQGIPIAIKEVYLNPGRIFSYMASCGICESDSVNYLEYHIIYLFGRPAWIGGEVLIILICFMSRWK